MRSAVEDYADSFCKLCMNSHAIYPIIYFIVDAQTLKIILKLIQVYNSAQSLEQVIINPVK